MTNDKQNYRCSRNHADTDFVEVLNCRCCQNHNDTM